MLSAQSQSEARFQPRLGTAITNVTTIITTVTMTVITTPIIPTIIIVTTIITGITGISAKPEARLLEWRTALAVR